MGTTCQTCSEFRCRLPAVNMLRSLQWCQSMYLLSKVKSDGLVEPHDLQRREMFGFPRLRALVAEHGKDGSLGDLLLEELYSFTGDGWEQEDDITLLTLRRSTTLS